MFYALYKVYYKFMCGIVGYIGKRSAKKVLLEGLKQLEYRGYDSSGMAVILKNKRKRKIF